MPDLTDEARKWTDSDVRAAASLLDQLDGDLQAAQSLLIFTDAFRDLLGIKPGTDGTNGNAEAEPSENGSTQQGAERLGALKDFFQRIG